MLRHATSHQSCCPTFFHTCWHLITGWKQQESLETPIRSAVETCGHLCIHSIAVYININVFHEWRKNMYYWFLTVCVCVCILNPFYIMKSFKLLLNESLSQDCAKCFSLALQHIWKFKFDFKTQTFSRDSDVCCYILFKSEQTEPFKGTILCNDVYNLMNFSPASFENL